MAICINSEFIFTGGYDGVIKKWTKKLDLLQSWQAHDLVVYAVVCDETRLFSSSSEGEVKEWDPKTGEFRQMTILQSPVTQQTTEVKTLGFGINGLLYGGDDGGNLLEWDKDFKVNKQKFTYIEIWSLAVSPDGQSVMTVRDNDVMINDVCKYEFYLEFCNFFMTIFFSY